jgi:hypothetical protein
MVNPVWRKFSINNGGSFQCHQEPIIVVTQNTGFNKYICDV